MAAGDQVLGLIRAHTSGDKERFRAIALQVAASTASRSERLSKAIREAVERAPVGLLMLPQDRELFAVTQPTTTLADMILDPGTESILHNVIAQHHAIDQLGQHGLSPDRKLLLTGPPGVGKTMAAAALAGALKLPLVRVQLHSLVSSHLGETGGKLGRVFSQIATSRAVYLFDEFDALGSARTTEGRGGEHDVGEMRRVVNSLLQMIELDQSSSLIVATTNLVTIIDHALFRRFDEVISFALPTPHEVVKVVRSRMLWSEVHDQIDWTEIGELGAGVGHADLVSATDRAHKRALMLGGFDGQARVTTSMLVSEIRRRLAMLKR